MVRDITQPSFAINPDFLPQLVTMTDDRLFAGVVRTVEGKLHIGDADGKVIVVDKADVASLKASPLSIMPDDLLKKLTPEQSRDLLTFLLTPAPRMPEDYAGTEKRPKPRTLAEVNAALAGAPNPPAKTRPIRVVLVAGAKDHGKGEHDYPAWLKAWNELLSAGDNIEVATAMEWPAKEEFQKADAIVFFQRGYLGRKESGRHRRVPRARRRPHLHPLGGGRPRRRARVRQAHRLGREGRRDQVPPRPARPHLQQRGKAPDRATSTS